MRSDGKRIAIARNAAHDPSTRHSVSRMVLGNSNCGGSGAGAAGVEGDSTRAGGARDGLVARRAVARLVVARRAARAEPSPVPAVEVRGVAAPPTRALECRRSGSGVGADTSDPTGSAATGSPATGSGSTESGTKGSGSKAGGGAGRGVFIGCAICGLAGSRRRGATGRAGVRFDSSSVMSGPSSLISWVAFVPGG